MSTHLSEQFRGAPTSEVGYLLAAHVAAHSSGSRKMVVTPSANEVTIDFSFFAYPKEIGDAVFASDISSLARPEQALVTALRAGLLSGAPRVDFESWDGKVGTRFRLTPDAIKSEVLSKAPWKDGSSGCRITVRFRTGLSRKLFGAAAKEETDVVRAEFVQRTEHSGCPVEYAGTRINKTFQLGQGLFDVTFQAGTEAKLRGPKIDCQANFQKEQDSSGAYLGRFLLGGEEGQSRVVCQGLEFEMELPLAEELGFVGLVVADHLEMDRELASLKDGTVLDDLLNDVESDLLRVAGGLVDTIDELEQDDVERVLDTLELVIETHRSSGDNDEAVELLKKMVEVENLPHEIRASHLTQLARTFERDQQDEISFEYYNRAIEYWGRIPTEEQNLELVASALLGCARLMGNHDNEPEIAIQYTRNALDLRRSVGSEDDIEKGEAAELLARLYSKHRRYPQPEFLEIVELLKVALHSYEQNYGATHNKVASVLFNLGKFCQDRGNLEEAESYFLRALAIKEKLFGSKDESVGALFDRLAGLFEAGGEIIKAGQYYARALEVREHLLGPDDPDVQQRLNDLVVLYRVYGHFDKAEPLFLRVLKLNEESEAGQDAQVDDLCSLALFYQVQSKYKKAEALFAKALALVDEKFVEDASKRAWVRNLFGKFYDEQYLFKKAEVHLLEALEMTEMSLGEEHPDLVVFLDALTRHYRLQQLYKEAMPWAERSLSVAEKFYGMQHPYVATALNSYGELLTNSGQAEAAGPIYLAAYEIQSTSENIVLRSKPVPDPQNSRLAVVRAKAESLHQEAATIARDYNSFAEAEALYLKALFLREQNLGADHPDNARTLGLLADLYRNHRRYEGAESLYRRALELRKKNLGEGHPDCCVSLSELTWLLLLQKQFENAKPLLEEWLAIVDRTLGKNHAERAEVLVRAGQVCEALKKPEKARALLQEAVNIRHSVFGTEHPTFAVTLAELLRLEEKPEQASELYDFVVVSLEKNLEQDDPLLIPIFENYAKVLLAIKNEEKAAVFETRAMVMRAEHGLDFGSVE